MNEVQAGRGQEPVETRIPVGGGVSLATFAWADGRRAEAAPVLLLHGLASSAQSWDGVAARLATAGHPVFALDWRSHGRSDRPEAGYDLTAHARDLEAVVDGLGLSGPILVGHSLGAMVILEAARRRPDLGRRVALIEGGLVDAAAQFATVEECLARLLPPVAGMPAARVEGFLRASNPGWSAERLASAMAAFDVQADGTVAWRLSVARRESLVRSMWDQRAASLWPALAAPLILAVDTGDAAWTARKREAAVAAGAAVPAARIEWLSGDHAIHEDRPDVVASLLLRAAIELWA